MNILNLNAPSLKLVNILSKLQLGNYILFAPFLMAPRPCRGGVGVGSVSFLPRNFFLQYHRPNPSPRSLTPIPSPRGEGEFGGGETSRMTFAELYSICVVLLYIVSNKCIIYYVFWK